MENRILPYLVVLSAVSVSLSAAFYSVTGIGKMFSGASMQVMIMMGSLEVAKLVLASLLYQYWGKINKGLKVYYFIALFVLMSITSAGIYGYLSSAYTETSNKVETVDKKVRVLDIRKDMFKSQLADLNSEKSNIDMNISQLQNGLSNNKQQSISKKGDLIISSSSSNRKSFEKQINSEKERKSQILPQISALNDSISNIEMQKLGLETNSDIASEIGPLKYIAKLTNRTVDQVVNWFIIALMLVFDPLAVSLVIGANIIFRDKDREKNKLKESEDIDKKIEDFNLKKDEISKLNEEYELKSQKIINYESELKEKESEFLKNEELSKENIKKIEDNISILTQEESLLKDKLKDLNSQVVDFDKKFEQEREDLNKLRKEIDEDIEDLNLEKEKVKDLQIDLENRESKISQEKDELIALDTEIKNWESTNWKMKRLNGGRPPSSI